MSGNNQNPSVSTRSNGNKVWAENISRSKVETTAIIALIVETLKLPDSSSVTVSLGKTGGATILFSEQITGNTIDRKSVFATELADLLKSRLGDLSPRVTKAGEKVQINLIPTNLIRSH